MSEVLKRWVVGELGIDALLLILSQIKCIDKVRCCLTLDIGGCDKRRELVVSDVFVRRQLNKVEQGLFLVDVREE